MTESTPTLTRPDEARTNELPTTEADLETIETTAIEQDAQDTLIRTPDPKADSASDIEASKAPDSLNISGDGTVAPQAASKAFKRWQAKRQARKNQTTVEVVEDVTEPVTMDDGVTRNVTRSKRPKRTVNSNSDEGSENSADDTVVAVSGREAVGGSGEQQKHGRLRRAARKIAGLLRGRVVIGPEETRDVRDARHNRPARTPRDIGESQTPTQEDDSPADASTEDLVRVDTDENGESLNLDKISDELADERAEEARVRAAEMLSAPRTRFGQRRVERTLDRRLAREGFDEESRPDIDTGELKSAINQSEQQADQADEGEVDDLISHVEEQQKSRRNPKNILGKIKVFAVKFRTGLLGEELREKWHATDDRNKKIIIGVGLLAAAGAAIYLDRKSSILDADQMRNLVGADSSADMLSGGIDGVGESVNEAAMGMDTAVDQSQPVEFVAENDTGSPERFEGFQVETGSGFEDSIQNKYGLSDEQAREAYERMLPHLQGAEGTYLINGDPMNVGIAEPGKFELPEGARKELEEYIKSLK